MDKSPASGVSGNANNRGQGKQKKSLSPLKKLMRQSQVLRPKGRVILPMKGQKHSSLVMNALGASIGKQLKISKEIGAGSGKHQSANGGSKDNKHMENEPGAPEQDKDGDRDNSVMQFLQQKEEQERKEQEDLDNQDEDVAMHIQK